MSDSFDANLQLKKRARRRLIGAFAFAGLAAVVLPMVMDEEPKQQVQDVQIRIPGQDQTPFNPKVKPVPAAVANEKIEKAALPEKPEAIVPPAVAAKPAEIKVEKPAEKQVEKPIDKTPAKPVEKLSEKPTAAGDNDPQRAAAILSGKPVTAALVAPVGNGSGQFVILIGAFSNPANVKQLQTKLGELGVKVFTETVDSPEGKKIRVRAGPFPSREAADKALDKMKRIGVKGVIAAKQ